VSKWHHTRGKRNIKRKAKPYKSYDPAIIKIVDGVVDMMLPRKLVSLNKLKNGLARHGDTKGWSQTLEKAHVVFDDGSFSRPHKYRVKLHVTRLSPREQFFLDQTNLAGGVKGLEDALVRAKYLVDDRQKWLDGPHVNQAVSADRRYWTWVRIQLLEELTADPPKKSRLKDTNETPTVAIPAARKRRPIKLIDPE
jgi:hypothetical protein